MAAGGLVYVLLILPASEKHPMRIDPSGTSNDHYKIDIPTSFLPFFLYNYSEVCMHIFTLFDT